MKNKLFKLIHTKIFNHNYWDYFNNVSNCIILNILNDSFIRYRIIGYNYFGIKINKLSNNGK